MKWNHLPVAGGLYDQDPDLLDKFEFIFRKMDEEEARKQEAEESKRRQEEAKRKREGSRRGRRH
jgi:hypothetical protein